MLELEKLLSPSKYFLFPSALAITLNELSDKSLVLEKLTIKVIKSLY